jgi:hypothetical protein
MTVKTLRNEITMNWDHGDPYGSAIEAAFQLCELAHFFRLDIPSEAEFQNNGHVLNAEEDFLAWTLREMWQHQMFTVDDLSYWIRVLVRYVDLLPEDRKY